MVDYDATFVLFDVYGGLDYLFSLEFDAIIPTAPDVTPPWVDSIYPPASSTIDKNQAVSFQLHDNLGIVDYVVWVDINGAWELAYAGQTIEWSSNYSTSTTSDISDGYIVTVHRKNGWCVTPIFHVFAIDAGGGEATSVIEWNYTVAQPAVVPEVSVPELAHETDHNALALGHLLEQYRDKPRIRSMLSSLIAQLQSIENVTWELMTERDIANALGDNLDVLGEIVGQPRQGMDDAIYRRFIRVKILANMSKSSIPEIIDILELAGFETVQVEDLSNANYMIYTTSNIDGLTDVGDSLANATKPAGVGMMFVYSNRLNVSTFRTLSYYSAGPDVVSQGLCSYHSIHPRGGYISGTRA